VDLPTVLAHHLRGLVDGLGAGDRVLDDALAALAADLEIAVSSYLGLRLSLVLDGWPVTFTAFAVLDGVRPNTSLRLTLSNLDRGFDAASHVVFYAGTPGTFVDLAADFGYLHSRSTVALDVDLPPSSVVPGFSGLVEYAAINRAVGVLLERGQDPDQARATLHRAASAAGMDLPGYAARLLDE
jgi:hypothetical protein